MCKHCNNVETIHYEMQLHKAKSSGQSVEDTMSRDDFDEMDEVASSVAVKFVQQAKRTNFDFGLVSGFSFAMEQNALAYYYYFEKPKDMQVQLDLLKQVESLRAALTLVQSRLIMTDNDSLKSVVEDALVKHNPKLNSADLASDLKMITDKANGAKAHPIDD